MLRLFSTLFGSRSACATRASVAALCLAAHAAGAAVISLRPVADNTLFEDPTGAVSNGAGESFFAGKTAIELRYRGVLRFDVSQIPSDAIVTAASLTLHCTRTIALAEPVTLHRALASWGEGTSNALGQGGRGAPSAAGDATWLHRSFGSQLWDAAGGDFVEQASASTDVAGIGAYLWNDIAMAADVQRWVAESAANHGWFVIGNEDLTASAKRFASRENAEEALRPLLQIEYTLVPAPGCALLFVGGMFGARRSRRKLSCKVGF